MRFPNIDDVAHDLREVNNNVRHDDPDEEGIDVRLQVYPGGSWAIRSGDSSYDQDHRGYWGAGSVPGNGRRFSARELARELIEQAREQYAMDKG
jgi:hypothetical protein